MDFPRPRATGRFVVLSGPSGSGKSTLIARFRELRPDVVRCLSATTRPPRGAERDGVDYHFLGEADFVARLDAGGFLEHAQVFGRHRYGTPRAPVEQALAEGRTVIKDVDVQGAAQIRQAMPDAVTVFVAPPSAEELERRLRGRGTESPEAVARRLAEAARELERWREFAHLVVNDDLERAARDLAAIVRAAELEVGG